MNKDILTNIIEDVVSLVDNKKAEDICVFHVSEKHWLTDYIVVLTVKNKVHAQSVLEDVKHFFSTLKQDDDLFEHPKHVGSPESGWMIVDANSIVVHCVTSETREFYDIDKLFSSQGDVYYY